jgi:hypothetical protein
MGCKTFGVALENLLGVGVLGNVEKSRKKI